MRAGLAAVVGVAILALAGCGGSTTTVTTTSPAEGTATTEEGATTAAPPEALDVGEGKVLTGIDNEQVKFTPLTYIDPLTPGQYDQPEAGQRLVAITWEMTNVGKKTYDSSPGNGALLILEDSTQVDHVITGSSTTECDYSSELNLAPGESRRGCIPFQVGESAKIKELQYALNSGYADVKGVWPLGG